MAKDDIPSNQLPVLVDNKDTAQAIIQTGERIIGAMKESMQNNREQNIKNDTKEYVEATFKEVASDSGSGSGSGSGDTSGGDGGGGSGKKRGRIGDKDWTFTEAAKSAGVAAQGFLVSEGMKAVDAIWDSSGFSNVINRQATDMFEGSVKQLVEKDVRQFAKAGIMPTEEEIETMMNLKRAENKVFKETMNYIDINSWKRPFRGGMEYWENIFERLGF